MIGLTIALLMMRIEAPLTSPSDACELGRLVIADLRPVYAGNTYVEVDPRKSELMKLCPDLHMYRPKGVAVASPHVRSCVSGKVTPVRCQSMHSGIYTIEQPRTVAAPNHAAVEVWFQCGATCGRGYIYFYVRNAKRWRRDGEPVPAGVS